MNRYPIVPFTSASRPLRTQIKPHSKAKPEGYFDGEKRIDPSIIEEFFTRLTRSSVIPDGYIGNVGLFLKATNNVIKNGERGNSHQVQCSVLSIEEIRYIPDDHSVIVHNILIRPRVWGLGFFRLVLLQLIISCYNKHASLWILNPSNEMIHELREISPKFHGDKNQDRDGKGKGLKFMILDFKDTESVMGRLFSGNSMIDYVDSGAIIIDDRYRFPASEYFNNRMGK